MPIYDIAMVIVLLAAIWFGYRKGLAWQIASIASLVVSYIVAYKFREPVAQFIQADAPWNKIGAMLILFLGTSLLIWTIYGRVNKSLKDAELKGFDRQAGALVGALKGGLICMVITMFAVSLLGDKAHQAIHTSKIGPWVESGIWQVSAIVPPEIAKYVDPHVENYKNQTGRTQEEIANAQQGGFFGSNPGNGTFYPASGTMSQNPGQMPQRQNAYQGEVQWHTGNQQQNGTQQNYNNYSGISNNTWSQGWQGQPTGQTNGQQNGQPTNNIWDDLNVSDVSREMLEAAKQKGVEHLQGAIENAAQNAIDQLGSGQQR